MLLIVPPRFLFLQCPGQIKLEKQKSENLEQTWKLVTMMVISNQADSSSLQAGKNIVLALNAMKSIVYRLMVKGAQCTLCDFSSIFLMGFWKSIIEGAVRINLVQIWQGSFFTVFFPEFPIATFYEIYGIFDTASKNIERCNYFFREITLELPSDFYKDLYTTKKQNPFQVHTSQKLEM